MISKYDPTQTLQMHVRMQVGVRVDPIVGEPHVLSSRAVIFSTL